MNTTTNKPKVLSPLQASQVLQSQPNARLIDVRTRAEFEQVHAQPAQHIPMDELNPDLLKDCDGPVLLICKSGARASNCAERLCGQLSAEICVVDGGTEAWTAAGLPVVRTNRRTISLERQVRITVGSLVLLFSILALTVDTRFAALPAFLGAGLLFAGITDWCGLGLLLARMPWNR
jgi:rhodanese-related sulfurtransferase